ncbi:ExeA family protein [Tuwongella immobilis]|uniref:AAA+ ATPase domain-containing protein n=1 Tax=Tuwongella immobilis TaxID=692036 RepID=A0A6C2YJ80_9BACT|nr:AAA family ATPase [Tuwongella immobilis]VIP01620.1 General secretion pathway protein A OS=Sulfurihydrogenibium yellowstonense SS-5 GN=SULYE_0252 PE=4 SV=1: AAA_22 [Tuwongella immobilis]VTR98949.1 General secretion pathway protein A OS=Sulfurihydrogenibium yellowstonense SS-5 GN=SULYE_0252 PE=4 SV=1: AAA_22 [Tuwongella immobilis]
MVTEYFGWTHRPFRPTPDLEAYYPATSHERALTSLTEAIQDDEGMALLIGQPGTGKTLVGLQLLSRLEGVARGVILTHGNLTTPRDLFQSVLFDLALPYQGLTEQECRLSLMENCLEHFRTGGRTLLICDEAHLLPTTLLEELRMLTNLSGRAGKAIQVVLIGQPQLLETLRAPELVACDQRIAARAMLDALDPQESADYLLHQVRAAGGRPERVFDPEALTLLAQQSWGFPRLLNQLGYACLKLAIECETRCVDAEVVLEVLARFGLQPETSIEESLDIPADLTPIPSIEIGSDSPSIHAPGSVSVEVAPAPVTTRRKKRSAA